MLIPVSPPAPAIRHSTQSRCSSPTTAARRLTVDNTANVADNPITLTGQLNPASDSGLSTGTPNVTNDRQPDFFGKSEPLSQRHPVGGSPSQRGPASVIGQVEAGSDGSWNIRSSIPLADGHYAITATAIDQFGVDHRDHRPPARSRSPATS